MGAHQQNPRIIAVANQKGGVAKTTTAINLAAALSLMGKKTLLIDLDAQGNASTGSNTHTPTYCTTDFLLGHQPIEKCITKTDFQYDILPSNSSLTHAEVELMKRDQREFVLQKQLANLTHDYEYILIDCPPSLNVLTINALVASHHVLIPVQCEYFALEGLGKLLNTIKIVQGRLRKIMKLL